MTKDEEKAVEVEGLERALNDEGKALDEHARELGAMADELEQFARDGEEPLDTLKRLLQTPGDDVLLAAAKRANDDLGIAPTDHDLEAAQGVFALARKPSSLSTWGLVVFGYATAMQRAKG